MFKNLLNHYIPNCLNKVIKKVIVLKNLITLQTY